MDKNQIQVNYDEVVQKLLENQKAMLLDNAILQVKADKLQQENETLKQLLLAAPGPGAHLLA